MKKDFDYEDDGTQWERARILVKIIPFVLIIVILAVTLLVNAVSGRGEDNDKGVSASSVSEETSAPSKMQDEQVILPTPISSSEPMPTKAPENSTPTPYREIMEKTDYSKVEFHTQEQLAEMMAYWEDSNQKALDDLANLDRFKAMSWHLSGTEDFYYYGESNSSGQPHGRGIAVYADNQYYYGEWVDGKRSGTGTWIHYHIHIQPNKTDIYTYHHYVGSWKNDLPDGEGFEHYDFNKELLKNNQYYNANLIGSYSEGLIDGEFYITTIENDDNMREWEAEASHGTWVYQNNNVDKKGNRTVQVEIYDSENYIWMNPKDNHDIGIPCLISQGRPQ